ncbi:hypothetical protein [Paenibacillus sp. Soil522]|uniref:hypothetical protein n=1 Tax=Paenibacillus sp. Soil522 TaxID=1736388 RepID=UPI0012DCF535|nr:hypothetical protein [Paenibacillus sp. Soil522]
MSDQSTAPSYTCWKKVWMRLNSQKLLCMNSNGVKSITVISGAITPISALPTEIEVNFGVISGFE